MLDPTGYVLSDLQHGKAEVRLPVAGDRGVRALGEQQARGLAACRSWPSLRSSS